MRVSLGDCLELLLTLEDSSVDAVVTDPPAGIRFMGKDWDGNRGGRDQWVAWLRDVMTECHRVLKPGGHALVWALPRTSHWTATAIEDAGFEIRDVGVHLFGTGFPKSLDVSKAIDKAAGAEPVVLGPDEYKRQRANRGTSSDKMPSYEKPRAAQAEAVLTAPATDAARQWQGWGTALKPAAEHWILARKPLGESTVAANVLAHGTGALNIDGCRIAAGADYHDLKVTQGVNSEGSGYRVAKQVQQFKPADGRWPAHVTLDEDAAALLDEQSLAGGMHSAGAARRGSTHPGAEKANASNASAYDIRRPAANMHRFGDNGGASRFYYVAKPSKAERGEGNTHPTVKSIALMRWLVRLVTPPGGVVLDPFMGSGSTGIACLREGFGFLGFEREPEYFEIAKRRLEKAMSEHG